MSDKQPDALVIAVHPGTSDAARAELIRQHALIEEMRAALLGLTSECEYKTIQGETGWHVKSMPREAALNLARAALTKAETQS